MWESRVLQRAFERLELHEGKLSRAVLRGGGGGDVTSLPDPQGSNPLGPPSLKLPAGETRSSIEPAGCPFPTRLRFSRGQGTTAVNIFEKQRNLLWANDLKQLITCCNYNYLLLHILFYIVYANLIVKIGDMGKDQVAPDHPDNPSSRC